MLQTGYFHKPQRRSHTRHPRMGSNREAECPRMATASRQSNALMFHTTNMLPWAGNAMRARPKPLHAP